VAMMLSVPVTNTPRPSVPAMAMGKAEATTGKTARAARVTYLWNAFIFFLSLIEEL